MLPIRCQIVLTSAENGVVKPFAGCDTSFPLDCAGGFGCYVVDDAVDVADFVYDAVGDFFQNVVWDTSPICRHEVGGCYAS